MNTSIDIIDAVFGGRGRIAILRLLAGQSESLTGTQIAELTGLTHAGATRALEHLARLGIVSRRRVGRAVLHQLERESVLVSTLVLPAIAAEASLMEVLRRDLSDAFGRVASSVVLFGSVARGEATSASDIDVLVVARDRTAATRAHQIADEVGRRFYRRHGLPLSVIVMTESALAKESPAFMARLRDEGVLVSGRNVGKASGSGA
jgi:predicted nucleotidyltransferase